MGPASASGGRWHTDRPPRFFIAGYNHADLLPQRHHSEHAGDRGAMRFFRCQLLHPHLLEDPRFYADRISEISAKTRKKSMNDGCEPRRGRVGTSCMVCKTLHQAGSAHLFIDKRTLPFSFCLLLQKPLFHLAAHGENGFCRDFPSFQGLFPPLPVLPCMQSSAS